MIWMWVGFNLFVLAMLALDLGVFHRKAHAVSLKEATVWSVVWISLAMLFNVGIYLFWDTLAPSSAYSNGDAALAFFTGYLIEKSLSVDNIFVFVMIFGYFATPGIYQHRVLYWGILTALVLRGAMILTGAALISRFDFLIALFGLLLIVTAIRMFRSEDEEGDLSNNFVVRLTQRFLPVTDGYRGQRFTIVEQGKRWITPLLVVLLVVETSDARLFGVLAPQIAQREGIHLLELQPVDESLASVFSYLVNAT